MLNELLLFILIGPHADENDRAELARNIPYLRAMAIFWLAGFLLWALS